MEPMILIAGSAVGAFTAAALRISKGNSKPVINNPRDPSTDFQRSVITRAMNKVYEHESEGRMTRNEREKLLAKYRQQLTALNNSTYGVTRHNSKELNHLRENLVTIMDQKMAQINSKLDNITNKIDNHATPAFNQSPAHMEKKGEKPFEASPKQVDQLAILEQAEDAESDGSLDEITKQIKQTLSRLEQAEVE